MTVEKTIMRDVKSRGGLAGVKLHTESSEKLWLLTLADFSEMKKIMEEWYSARKNADLPGKRRFTIF